MKRTVIIAALAAAVFLASNQQGSDGAASDGSSSWDAFFGFIGVAREIAKGRQPAFITEADAEKRRQIEVAEADAQRKRQLEIDAEAERQKRASMAFFDSLNAPQKQIQQQMELAQAAEAERRTQQQQLEAQIEADAKRRQQELIAVEEAAKKHAAEAVEAERKRAAASQTSTVEAETEAQRRARIFARGGGGAQQVGAIGAAAGSAILLLATADHSAFESKVPSCPAGYDDTGAFCTKWRVTGQVCADDCSKGWDSCRRRGALGECWGGCRESCSPVKVVEETLEKRTLPCPAEFPMKRSGLCYRK